MINTIYPFDIFFDFLYQIHQLSNCFNNFTMQIRRNIKSMSPHVQHRTGLTVH